MKLRSKLAATSVAAIALAALGGAGAGADYGDPENVFREPFASQAHEPLLEGPLVGGSDPIPTDATGVGAAHIRRLPSDGEMTSIELQIADDTITAINWERARRDTDPTAAFSPGAYPLELSANATRIAHRWAEWLGNWHDTRSGADVGMPCPANPNAANSRTCHATFPLWDDTVFLNDGNTIAHAGGGSIVGPSPQAPGAWVRGWTASGPHRGNLLTNRARYASVAVDCRADGTTFVEWLSLDHDFGLLRRSPATAANAVASSILPDGSAGDSATIPVGFGHRCPRPAHLVLAAVSPGAVSLTAAPGVNSALKESYLFDPAGPALAAPINSWRLAGTIRSSTGAWPVDATVYDAAGVRPVHVPLPAGSYSFEYRWENAHEVSQTGAVTFTVPAPSDEVFVGNPPSRVVDTRRTGERLAPNGVLSFDPGVTEAAAVQLNVTAVAAAAPGFVTVYPCTASPPRVSNVNWTTAGAVVANAAVVQPNESGQICLTSNTAVDVVVDVTGYYRNVPAMQAAAPRRLWDSRSNGEPRRPGHVTVLHVGPVGAAALNLTVTQPRSAGYLTAYPCAAGRPVASNVNYSAGATVAGLGLVAPDANGDVCVFSLADAHLVVDWFGALGPDAAVAMGAPSRLLDSRTSTGPRTRWMLSRPSGSAGAVVLNVTAVGPAANGHLTIFPCTSGTEAAPTTSILNYRAGESAVANLAVIDPSPSGHVCITSHAITDLVVDYLGSID